MNTTMRPGKSVRKIGKVREYVEAFAVALLIALLVRTLVIQAFKIPSSSMEDTLLIGDHIFVNKFLFGYHFPYTKGRILRFSDPQRGDIIVFVFPEDTSKDFIKRVVGVPGDTIEIRRKRVFLNGLPLEENTSGTPTAIRSTVSSARGTTFPPSGCLPESCSSWGTTGTGPTTPGSGDSSTWTRSSGKRCSSTFPWTGTGGSRGPRSGDTTSWCGGTASATFSTESG
jgi:signal peptidase I